MIWSRLSTILLSLNYFHSCDVWHCGVERATSCSLPMCQQFDKYPKSQPKQSPYIFSILYPVRGMKSNADESLTSSPSQCPSRVMATCLRSISSLALSPSLSKASKANSLKASKADFGSFMAFLSFLWLHPFLSEMLWQCLSHAVKTNITWVKILKSTQYKVSKTLSILFQTSPIL